MALQLRAVGASVPRVSHRAPHSRRVCCLASKQPSPADAGASTSAPAADAAPVNPITRDLGKALGSRVVESNVAFQGPEDQPDFWEGEKFETLGKVLENYFVPGLVVLGIVCGGIAAKSYNEGATAFVKPPTSPDAAPSIIIALPKEGASAPNLAS